MMLNNEILTSMKNIASKKVHLLEGVIAIIKERKKNTKLIRLSIQSNNN